MLSSLFITEHIQCVIDDDCPKSLNKLLVIKCIHHVCQYVGNLPDFASQVPKSTKMPYKGEWVIVQKVRKKNVKYLMIGDISKNVI